MMTWSEDSLRPLFTSGGMPLHLHSGGEMWDYWALATALDIGRIRVERVRVQRAPNGQRGDPTWETWNHGQRLNRNESDKHKRLKWWGACWLRELGEEVPEFEVAVPYGRADVWGPALHHAVECGDSDVRKIGEGLCDGLKAVTIIPYPAYRKAVWAWRFTAPVPLSPHEWRDHLVGIADQIVEQIPAYRSIAPSSRHHFIELPPPDELGTPRP